MKKLFLKGKYIFLLFLIILILAFNYQNTIYNFINNKTININRLTNEQWIKDINYLDETLTKYHPNLKENSSEFEYKILKLKEEANKLNDMQITTRLMQIVASLGDGHTQIKLNNDKIYPLGLWWYGTDLRVATASKGYKRITTTKLISINKIPIDKIVEKINTLIPYETDQWIKCQNVAYIVDPEILKSLEITSGDTALWSFERDDGEIISIDISPQEKEIKLYGYQLTPNSAISPSLTGNNSNFDGYWYKYIPQDKIFYFQYNICEDRFTASSDNSTFPIFCDFVEKMKTEIDKNVIDKFIIDLRWNFGGNSSVIKPFIDMLSCNQKLNKRGKIFVITSRRTFSGGVWAGVDILENTNAISIGEPTGGIVNCTGNVNSQILQNSKLILTYSTKQFLKSTNYKGQIIPDIIINQSIEDLKQGIDDTYQAIKNYEDN